MKENFKKTQERYGSIGFWLGLVIAVGAHLIWASWWLDIYLVILCHQTAAEVVARIVVGRRRLSHVVYYSILPVVSILILIGSYLLWNTWWLSAMLATIPAIIISTIIQATLFPHVNLQHMELLEAGWATTSSAESEQIKEDKRHALRRAESLCTQAFQAVQGKKFYKAYELFNDARDIYVEFGRLGDAADSLMNMGMARLTVGEAEQAAEDFGKAGQYYEQVKARPKLGMAYLNQGLAHDKAFKSDKALCAFTRAEKEFEKLGTSHLPDLAEAVHGKAQAYHSMEKFAQALAFSKRAEQLYQEAGHYLGQARMAYNGAGLQLILGDIEASMKAYEMAEELFRQENAIKDLASTLQHQAEILSAQGNHALALQREKEGYAWLLRLAAKGPIQAVFTSIGVDSFYFTQDQTNPRYYVARSQIVVAYRYISLGGFATAFKLLDQAEQELHAIGYGQATTHVDYTRAVALTRQKKYQQAERLYRAIIKRLNDTPRLLITEYRGLAEVLEAQHRYRDAFPWYERVICRVEEVRGNINWESGRIGYFADETVVYARFARLCLKLQPEDARALSIKPISRALELVEGGKSRLFLEQLGQSGLSPPAHLGSARIDKERVLLTQITKLVNRQREDPFGKGAEDWLEQQDHLEKELRDLWKDMETESREAREYVTLRLGKVACLEEMKSCLLIE